MSAAQVTRFMVVPSTGDDSQETVEVSAAELSLTAALVRDLVQQVGELRSSTTRLESQIEAQNDHRTAIEEKVDETNRKLDTVLTVQKQNLPRLEGVIERVRILDQSAAATAWADGMRRGMISARKGAARSIMFVIGAAVVGAIGWVFGAIRFPWGHG